MAAGNVAFVKTYRTPNEITTLMSLIIPFLLMGSEWALVLGLLVLLVLVFIVLPIVLAVKYPTFRIALGVVNILAGLLLAIGLWWLFGIGLFLGIPLLLLGLVSVVTGSSSRAKRLGRSEAPIGPQRFCVSCGRAVTGNGKFCAHCGKELPP